MNKIEYIYLNRKAFLAAMISAAFPTWVNAAAGKVEFASGGAAVQGTDGSSRILAKGMDINTGDTILTGPGRAQIKFTDGGFMSFQPDTQFKIEDYNFDGKQDGSEKGFFRLIEGGLRAVTGLVGKQNKTNYRVATPVATIGIRGTYFLAEFREKLRTHVGQGSIYVFNEQGDIILFEGQSAEVEAGGPPKYTDEELTLGARGPVGGKPEDVNRQLLAENEINSIFQVTEQYGLDGLSASIGGISAVMANLNGINAEGIYVLDSNVANVGSGSGYTSVGVDSVLLFAQFGSRQMYGDFNIASTSSYSGSSSYSSVDSFNVSGNMLPSGSFALSGSGGGGNCSYGGCSINVVGMFSGAQAEKAGVGYVVKETTPNFVSGFAALETITPLETTIVQPPSTIKFQGTAGIISVDALNTSVPAPPRPGAIADYNSD